MTKTNVISKHLIIYYSFKNLKFKIKTLNENLKLKI